MVANSPKLSMDSSESNDYSTDADMLSSTETLHAAHQSTSASSSLPQNPRTPARQRTIDEVMTSDLHSPSSGTLRHITPRKELEMDGGQSKSSSTKWKKKLSILSDNPLPKHWEAPTSTMRLGRLRAVLFHVLCLASLGNQDMKQVWAAIKLAEFNGDESVWEAGTRENVERLNNQMLVSGILLTVVAVFLTTAPPPGSTMDWLLPAPYTCLLVSFGTNIGCVVVASALSLATSKTRAEWAEKVHYSTTFRLNCTLLMMAYPTFSIGVSTVLLALAMLTSLWGRETSASLHAAAGVVPFTIPISVTIMVLISRLTGRSSTSDEGMESPQQLAKVETSTV